LPEEVIGFVELLSTGMLKEAGILKEEEELELDMAMDGL
jgi:hypothetical protein